MSTPKEPGHYWFREKTEDEWQPCLITIGVVHNKRQLVAWMFCFGEPFPLDELPGCEWLKMETPS